MKKIKSQNVPQDQIPRSGIHWNKSNFSKDDCCAQHLVLLKQKIT